MADYKETYGYKLAHSRNAAGWTQGELADAINTHKKKLYVVPVALIRQWEANERVPRNDQIKLITEVLAEKLQLDDAGKQELAHDLMERAAKTRELISAGDVVSGETHFGNLLREKMEAAGINENGLADLIKQKMGKPYSFDDIYQIEHGHTEPPPEFVKLAQQVIDRKPHRHNVVSHVLSLLGEDEFRRIKGCGADTINQLDHGLVDHEKLKKILENAKQALTAAGHLDAEGKFKEGEYQGQNYLDLIAAEYAQQTGKKLPQRR